MFLPPNENSPEKKNMLSSSGEGRSWDSGGAAELRDAKWVTTLVT